MPQATPAAVSSVDGLVQNEPEPPVRYRSARRDRRRRPPRTLRSTPLNRIDSSIRLSGGSTDHAPPTTAPLERPSHRHGRFRLFGLRREVFTRIDEAVALERVLLVVQLPVPAVQRQQFRVRPVLDDLTG